MFIDLHCHTIYSGDSDLQPIDLIHTAREMGLDAVCVTEHDSFCASEPIEKTAESEGFLVLRGVEINTDKGHILAFGVTDDSWKDNHGYYIRIDSVRGRVEACRGILIPAHPFRTFGSASASKTLFSMDYIAAMEVLNGENNDLENDLALRAWEKLGIPGTGGSDCHFTLQVGRYVTWFERQISTIEQMIEEIRAGRVAPAYLGSDGAYIRADTSTRIGEKAE